MLICLFLSVFSTAWAAVEQTSSKITVTGVVKDVQGEPLIGATIKIKGSAVGTVSDFDGNYSLANVPVNGVLEFSYLRDDKPYMAYCKKCHKEFSILKDTIFVRKETDFRFWLYIGYLHYRMQTDMIIDRLNIAALQRDMQGTTYKSLCRINRKLARWFDETDASDRDNIFASLHRIL